MKEYPCNLPDKNRTLVFCKYGGNKHYNYGFTSGTASYCRKAKRWVCDLTECPLGIKAGEIIKGVEK